MVISHDWAGDQQENLRLIWELLKSVRRTGTIRAPLMMIEDLEQHPYPVDLSFFSPVARTSLPYGHRLTLSLPDGMPTSVELGTPLYGGGIVLGFSDTWWRKVDVTSLTCAFNFLLFNEFDDARLNSISGGPDPVLSPPLLDMMTGFGTRAIDGADVRKDQTIKRAMIQKAPLLADCMPHHLRKRWACRMVLLESLLELEAAGATVDDLMPSCRFKRRAGDAGLPFTTLTMAQLYEAAKVHAQDLNMAYGRQRRDGAKNLIPMVRTSHYQAACLSCSVGFATENSGTQDTWRAVYIAARQAVN
jgi:hypothetical protein